ncbi:MAG: helix-turn-helix transcriptional regulator, partial [Clostridia bacterium]|nr:helix-turn-helix transcriptional regulator [Clostridia bacterium]
MKKRIPEEERIKEIIGKAAGHKTVEHKAADETEDKQDDAFSDNAVDDIFEIWEEARLLTSREKEVVRLLLEGKQRKQIASELFITEHTVKDHVSNSYKKLGVKNKGELFAKAYSI